MGNFSEGQTVFYVSQYGNMKKSIISKVLKNGNVKIDGKDQQYRPSGGATGNWSRSMILRVDEESTEMYKTQISKARFLAILAPLKDFSGTNNRIILDDLTSEVKVAMERARERLNT